MVCLTPLFEHVNFATTAILQTKLLTNKVRESQLNLSKLSIGLIIIEKCSRPITVLLTDPQGS